MKKAFTLIELLVVIAVIALLSTLSVVALGGARAKARDARRLSDIKQIQTALEMYLDSSGTYPASLTAGTPLSYGGLVFL
jgi:prepilin-type N-terminal cleavage/methylation domain-containing protein